MVQYINKQIKVLLRSIIMAYTKTSFICLLLFIYMGYFHFSRKQLPLKSTKVFNGFYISAFSVVFFDYVTLCTVNLIGTVPEIINLIVHILYMLSINTMIYVTFLYEKSLLGEHLKIGKGLQMFYQIPYVISSLLVIILPIDYISGKYTNYSTGPKVYAVYICVIFYNMIICYYGIRYIKFLQKEKRTALLASVPLFVIVSAVSLVFPESLIVILYVTLSATGLLMSSENIDKYMDERTGMFNQYALGVVIREFITLKKQRVASVIILTEGENSNLQADWKSKNYVLEQLQNFCNKEFSRQVYRISDNGFVLLETSLNSATRASEKLETYIKTLFGGYYHLEYSLLPLSDFSSGNQFMSKIVDVCVDSINKAANYDFLTGTRNRNSFEKFLTRLREKNEDVYYFIADVNNLKETNDVLGHAAGDELIQTTAKLLCDTVGNEGWVFRQGGDEFAVLWKGQNPHIFLDTLEQNTKAMNLQRPFPVSFAVGYGKILDSTGLEDADKMMYENKLKMKANLL